jgi:hypothetical protein
MHSPEGKGQIILDAVRNGLLTFVAIEAAALALAVMVLLVEKYTAWFNLGDERNTWLVAASLYWAALPAIFFGLVVFARVLKFRWNQDSTRIR